MYYLCMYTIYMYTIYMYTYSGWVLQRCFNFGPPQEDISTTSSPQDTLKHRQLLTNNDTSHKPKCERHTCV